MTAAKTAAPLPKEKGDKTPKISEPQENPDKSRDVRVSDVIWQQLQKDKRELGSRSNKQRIKSRSKKKPTVS